MSVFGDRSKADRTGVRACAQLLRSALTCQNPDFSDVIRGIQQAVEVCLELGVPTKNDFIAEVAVAGLQPCIDEDALRAIGIAPSDEILRFMLGYPRYVLFNLQRKLGSPYIDDLAKTLAQIYWTARDSVDIAEFFAIERDLIRQFYKMVEEQIFPLAEFLTAPKVETQRWVISGVYDTSVAGAPQLSLRVKAWGDKKIVLRGLPGKARHDLLKQYRAGLPLDLHALFEFEDRLLFHCAPRGFFLNEAEASELARSSIGRDLVRVCLWLSGIVVGPLSGSVPKRSATDTTDVKFLFALLRLKGSTGADARHIVMSYLWEHQHGETGWGEWRGNKEENTLHGYVATALGHELNEYQKTGSMAGDKRPKEWLVSCDPAKLDFLRFPDRSRGKPALETYDGGNRNDFSPDSYENRKGDVGTRSDALTAHPWLVRAEQPDELERKSRHLDPEATGWIGRGSVRQGKDVAEAVMVMHDISKAFHCLYRDQEMATRDCKVFVARYFLDRKRRDVAKSCGLSASQAHAAWRQLEPDRKLPALGDWLLGRGYSFRHTQPRLIERYEGYGDVEDYARDETGKKTIARDDLRQTTGYLRSSTHTQRRTSRVSDRSGNCIRILYDPSGNEAGSLFECSNFMRRPEKRAWKPYRGPDALSKISKLTAKLPRAPQYSPWGEEWKRGLTAEERDWTIPKAKKYRAASGHGGADVACVDERPTRGPLLDPSCLPNTDTIICPYCCYEILERDPVLFVCTHYDVRMVHLRCPFVGPSRDECTVWHLSSPKTGRQAWVRMHTETRCCCTAGTDPVRLTVDAIQPPGSVPPKTSPLILNPSTQQQHPGFRRTSALNRGLNQYIIKRNQTRVAPC